jgi:uncharacterized membrane protein YobD (UPF0266 family)
LPVNLEWLAQHKSKHTKNNNSKAIHRTMYRSKNEVIIFLINIFLYNVFAKGAVLVTLWLFRIFGMPQLYIWYSHLNHPERWRYYIILVFCTSISIIRILRNNKKAKEKANKKNHNTENEKSDL